MNLKKLLNGNADQLLTSQDYRIASQLRVHAGKLLMWTTPLVAIGAVTNSPVPMIPALYIPSALLIPPINYFLMKSVPKGAGVKVKNWLFNPVIGIGVLLVASQLYHLFFAGADITAAYAREHGMHMLYHQLKFQSEHHVEFLVLGLVMAVICGWLSYTLALGRRTQSMQRIAQHLAIQEAENA